MSQGAESQVRTMIQPACWRRPRLLRGQIDEHWPTFEE
jgi:hypothetical protein